MRVIRYIILSSLHFFQFHLHPNKRMDGCTSPFTSPSEQAELQALRYLSNDALWTMAAEQMAAPLQERMAQLLDDNQHRKLTLKDQNELASLIERGDQLMLHKAEAIRLLHQRGYALSPQTLTPSCA